jgi:DNA-binding NtrC family response regulator
LIDDEAQTSWAGILDTGLRGLGFELHLETEAVNGVASISKHSPDVVLLDLHFPEDGVSSSPDGGTTGGLLLATLRAEFPALPVVLFSTRFADADTALERFETAPHAVFSKHQITSEVAGENAKWPAALAATLRGAIELAATENSPETGLPTDFIVGLTPGMRRAAAAIRQAAPHDEPVLIQGETGSGKTSAARAIHDLSARSTKGRFVHLHCGGRDERTLAAELFGCAAGAVPGTASEQPGLIEQADQGTLFIEEFQLLPDAVQNGLLRVLETGQVRRVGDLRDRPADIRLLIASSHAIGDLVEDGVIQGDFAYRIISFMVTLPPLRERLDDLPELFAHFLQQINASRGKNMTAVLRPEVLTKLKGHAWRGNLRELRTVLDRAVLTTPNNLLMPDDILLPPLAAQRSRPSTQFAELHNAKAADALVTPPAPPSFADEVQQFIVRMSDAPVAQRWTLLVGDGKPATAVRKAALEGNARRLWSTRKDGRIKIGIELLCFLIDTGNLAPGDNWDKAYARVRTMVKAHGIQLTKLDYSNSNPGH